MRLDDAIGSLENSSQFLQQLTFTHPKAFQNTLLSRVSITSVIRDAEPHEAALFTSSGLRKSALEVPDSGASEVLRSRDASVEVLLNAVEKICDIYPVDGDQVRSQVDLMRHKYATLVDSIDGLEREVEAQRRQLDLLSSGREYSVAEDDSSSPTTPDSSGSQKLRREEVEEMIRVEEEEIMRLEQVIEQKTIR